MNTQMKLSLAALALTGVISIAVQADGGHNHDQPAPSNSPAKDPHETDPHADPDPHADHDPHGDDEHDHAGDAHVDEVKLTPEAIKQYGVTTGIVSRQSLVGTVTAPARVAFNTDAMAHVGSAITGRANDLKVKLGDRVERGDLLIVVDSPELGEAQSDFLLKRTAVMIAKPAVQLTKDAYNRAKQLLDQSQGIALAEVQKREAEWRTAEGNLRAAEASATAAENKLHLYGMSQDAVRKLVETGEIVPQYRITAPIAGQVVEREVTLGELVRPDRDSLLVIADLSTAWVIADVPEARIGEIGIGGAARISLAALKNRVLDGKVTYIAPALDPNTRSAKVRIEVNDPTGTIRPGMFAQASIRPASIDEAGAVLAVPEEAIQTVEGGPAVFVPVEGEPNTFAKRSVTVGPSVAGLVPVLSGLDEGDVLVVAGSFILKAELGKAGAAHEH